MRVLDAAEICARAPMGELIECLRKAFRDPPSAAVRQIAPIPGGHGDRLLLYMPAFDGAGTGAIKLVTIFPDNGSKGLPTIQAALVVFSATGTPVAVLDGAMVTRLRTGAASALASTYLSRADSVHLLVIGTGALAPYMALAHSTVRPIRRITVSGRREERARETADEIRSLLGGNIEVGIATALAEAVANADIICCATSSAQPVLAGKWLRPGVFLDLVGGFSPAKREVDDEAVLRSRLFVDTFEGALAEAGDLLQPLERGLISRERIEGELSDLVSGRTTGRRSADEIILFKSVGTAIEDLAAAKLIVAADGKRHTGKTP
ncbi:MAG TPA: ornithine cyclodeaminase family protein [Steroidobacteraceae bacterium]|nr:ornithine cyclodeaminase family protein [Steroidobacteraceae bacterium]